MVFEQKQLNNLIHWTQCCVFVKNKTANRHKKSDGGKINNF